MKLVRGGYHPLWNRFFDRCRASCYKYPLQRPLRLPILHHLHHHLNFTASSSTPTSIAITTTPRKHKYASHFYSPRSCLRGPHPCHRHPPARPGTEHSRIILLLSRPTYPVLTPHSTTPASTSTPSSSSWKLQPGPPQRASQNAPVARTSSFFSLCLFSSRKILKQPVIQRRGRCRRVPRLCSGRWGFARRQE